MRDPQLDIYDPKTLAVMDQAFAAIWTTIRGPVRNNANDSELRIEVGHKLLNLVADGVTDPIRLRQLTVRSLFSRAHAAINPSPWASSWRPAEMPSDRIARKPRHTPRNRLRASSTK